MLLLGEGSEATKPDDKQAERFGQFLFGVFVS